MASKLICIDQETDKTMIREQSILEILEDIRPLKILLIDEDITSQLRTVRVLEDWHKNIDLCSSIGEAIKKIKLKCYDLVIIDLNLSLIDGFELTRTIKNKAKMCQVNTNVIGLADTDHPLLKNMTSYSQIDNYLLKSKRETKLINTIINQCYLNSN